MDLKKWLITGIAAVSILFLLPGVTGELWLSVLLGGIAVVIFFGMLLQTLFNKEGKNAYSLTLAVIMVLYLAFAGFSGWTSYQHSNFQHDILTDIRHTIDEDIIRVHTREPLLHTLRNFNEQDAALNSLFQDLYGDKIDNSGRFLFPYDDMNDEPPFLFVDELETDKISLVGLSTYTKGTDDGFENFDGSAGNIQFRATLTDGGIQYDREN